MIIKYIIPIISIAGLFIFINWLRKSRKKLRLRRKILKIIFNFGDSMDKEKIAQSLATQKIIAPKDLMLFLWTMSTDGLLEKIQKRKEWMFSLTEAGKKLLPKQKKEIILEAEMLSKGGEKR
ncbi:hypothetical protein COU00_03940 [Candidatus Falkowbacteria bacterium CG10_big_fil_rev_8_21_14_0_10_43_11]|uniref:ArnR1-like winged helix-turn-helix domain-containing protein n=1 Tax=Candidatus Falkowbacteria bacterium CG10_big_fil_rev_8_21_14_0_10_43_11 TaxID=1974568 RepID=A0A2M6WL97_9BACT|nr:MAG: hypothetical protein COU00_03940 [Candidatus Falkowbacteria bacterium CG10_big_fil_rev_8_21_14_0_10_43_11]